MAKMTNYDHLSALDKVATPAPWKTDNFDEVWNEDYQMRVLDIRGWGYLTQIKKLTVADAIKEQESNAALIVAMRNALPEILAEIEFLQKERNDLLGRLGKIKETLEEFPHEISPTAWEYLYESLKHPDASDAVEEIKDLRERLLNAHEIAMTLYDRTSTGEFVNLVAQRLIEVCDVQTN